MMFYKEINFKETPIGNIPKDWKAVKLGAILNLRNGKRPKISENGNIPVFGANGIMGYTTRFLTDNDFTIIVGRVGASGRVHLGNGRIWISDNAIYGETYDKSKAYLPFIYRLLESKNLEQFASKTTHPIITQTFLKNFVIQLPMLGEQQRINEVISVADNAIQKTDELIAKTERLKKGLMQELLTKGIGHKKFKDTEIGRIPETWTVVRLEDVVEIDKESRDPSREMSDKTFLYVDIDSIEVGTGKIRSPKRILGKNAPSRARRVVHENDVIMSTVRPYLKAFAIVPGEYDNQICSTGFAVLSCGDNVLPYFLLNVLFSNQTIIQCNRMMVGGQYPALNQSQVSKIKIPLPPLPEQQKIANIFNMVDQNLELERKEKERLERIKQGLMNWLLTGKVRVKVA